MRTEIPYFGSVAPVKSIVVVGGAEFNVLWMIADTDLEVLASGGKPFNDDLVNDVGVNRTRLGRALYQVEHKIVQEDDAGRDAMAAIWPDPLSPCIKSFLLGCL